MIYSKNNRQQVATRKT